MVTTPSGPYEVKLGRRMDVKLDRRAWTNCAKSPPMILFFGENRPDIGEHGVGRKRRWSGVKVSKWEYQPQASQSKANSNFSRKFWNSIGYFIYQHWTRVSV